MCVCACVCTCARMWARACLSGTRRARMLIAVMSAAESTMFEIMHGFLGGYSDEVSPIKGKKGAVLGQDGGGEGIWGKNGDAIRTPGKDFGCKYYCDRQTLANTSKWSKTARGELYGVPPPPPAPLPVWRFDASAFS